MAKTEKPKCSKAGCTKDAVAKGMCINHYQQQRNAAIKAGKVQVHHRSEARTAKTTRLASATGKIGSLELGVPTDLLPALELLAARDRVSPKEWCQEVLDRAITNELKTALAPLMRRQ